MPKIPGSTRPGEDNTGTANLAPPSVLTGVADLRSARTRFHRRSQQTAIAANPQTKFILFHGGYPWIGETGAIATRYQNVWIDSVWLPTISFTMAHR